MAAIDRRTALAAAAGAIALMSSAALAQVGGIGAQLRDIARAQQEAERLRLVAGRIGPAGRSAADRADISQEVDGLIVALEAFQAEREGFSAALDGVLRLEAARSAYPTARNETLEAQSNRMRRDLSARITRLGQMNADLRAQLAASPRIAALTNSGPGLMAQGTLREDLGEALETNVGTRGMVREQLRTLDLTATQIAELQTLAQAYRGLDASFLGALEALYAARGRLYAVS